MSMNLLALTNKVLLRLREDQVSSLSETDYGLMVADFVRQAITDVESYDWNVLRSTIQVNTVADDFSYVLTGAGQSFSVLDVFENSEDYVVQRAPSYAWMNHMLLSNNVASGAPRYFDFNGASGGDPVVNFYPVPDGVYTVNFNLAVRTDVTDDDAAIEVPWRPVVLRALTLAIGERGDGGGLSLQSLQEQYARSLADAIALDAGNRPEETVWFEE